MQQTPLHGVSMLYSFDDTTAAERHTTQYFEIFCNRGIYHKGWVACTKHSMPWEAEPDCAILDDVWELLRHYDGLVGSEERRQGEPREAGKLKTLFLLEADKYLVTPLDDRKAERFIAELVGRPELISGNTQFFASGMKRLSPRTRSSSSRTSPTRSRPTSRYSKAPRPRARSSLRAANSAARHCIPSPASPSTATTTWRRSCSMSKALKRFHRVSSRFGWSSAMTAAAWEGRHVAALYLDGRKVGEARVDATAQGTFSLDETTDVGEETGTTVAEDVTIENSRFNGRIRFVQIDIGIDKDHFLSPEERFHIAMARK